MFLRTALFGLKALEFQWKSPEDIRKFQEKKLRSLVEFAYKHSLFYKRIFLDHGVHPADIKTLEDLPKLPLVTRQELIQNFSQVISKGYSEKNCAVDTTSGSTGERITILQDYQAIDYYGPVHIRGQVALGLNPWNTSAVIRYAPLEDSFIQTLGLFKFKHIYSHLPVSEIIETLKQISPFAIGCYPTVMYVIAKEISEKDAQALSPHYILTWSEKLTNKIRRKVEDVFNCPVYDQYGSFEAHIMAVECPEKRMHINADVLIFEFLDESGEQVNPGESGEIVITNLWNKAMPFIRYKIGDIGIPSDEQCECGRGLPVMEGLVGRTDDFLTTVSGNIVLPSEVVPLFFPFQEIDAFQIVQKQDTVVLKIVKGKKYSHKIDLQLINKFKEILGQEMTIEVEHVPKIEKTQGGKQRTIMRF
jgi:phenylacetate-CoA ligase